MLIPEGKYRGEIRGSHALRFSKSSAKETRQVEVDLRFLEGEPRGEVRRWVGFFSTAAIDRTLEVLRALFPRWTSDSLRDLVAESEREPVRVEVELVVVHEPFDRKDGSKGIDDRIAFVNVGGRGIALSADELDDFDRCMRPSVAAVKQTNVVPPAPAARASAPPARSAPPGGGFGDDPPPHDDRDAPPARGRGGHPFGGG